MNEWKKELEKQFVYIPSPEQHKLGTLLKPYELRGSVGDLERFIDKLLNAKTGKSK